MAKEKIESLVGIIIFYALIVFGVYVLNSQMETLNTSNNHIASIR